MEWGRELAEEYSGVRPDLVLDSFVVVKRKRTLASRFVSSQIPAAPDAPKSFAVPLLPAKPQRWSLRWFEGAGVAKAAGLSRNIRGWIEKSRFKKDAEARQKLSATWAEFQGIVPMLWRALGAADAASAA